MEASLKDKMSQHQELNEETNTQTFEMKEEMKENIENESVENKTNDNPFDYNFGDKDPFTNKPVMVNNDSKNDGNNLEIVSTVSNDKKHPQKLFKKQLTLYSTMDELNEPLPLPYKKNCSSKIYYYFETFLVTHPRMYALFLLYQATWPRGLVLLDMWTDIQVAISLYNNGQSLWFLLSSMFIILPFILVWTVSLRFIQKFINNLYSKEKSKGKCMSTMINFGLTLYIFPPIGALFVALYEVYLVFYDILNGIKCFIFGTGLVETQTNDIRAMKQYRRAVEIFSESVPQTLLQLYMFARNVPVDERDLYISLVISGFNLFINAYRFRKEAKINGMSIAEYALSVLQLAEIPIVRLVPRLPAVKKGKLEFINLAGFTFDKESITPIIEALGEARCVLNTMKISIGSLINLDLESCRLIGRILKDARVRVFVSRTFSLLHIKNLFEELDDDHNGYLDENEFLNALKSLNSGLLYMDQQQQKRIFQKLAIRRIKKRDRVYFYDFFKNTASVTNKSLEFDVTQMDFPLHYIFQHLMSEIGKNDAIENMQKLYHFCCGLNCFDEIDRTMNNHIFFTIIDALNLIENKGDGTKTQTDSMQFIIKCFHEMLESDIIHNAASTLLEIRNNIFEKGIDDKEKWHEWVYSMYESKEYDGLNIFEYCFANKNTQNRCYVFVYLLDVYLKTKVKSSGEDKEAIMLFSDKNGVLFNLYNASKFRWRGNVGLSIEYAAKYALFDVVEYFAKYLITDYSAEEIYKVCVLLLSNENNQSPETLGLILKYAQNNGMNIVNITAELDLNILRTKKKIEVKKEQHAITESQFNEINNELLRNLEILNEYGFNFNAHLTLQHAVKNKSHDMISKVIEMCREKSYDDILKVLNDTNNGINDTPIMTAYNRQDLTAMDLLLKCQEQDCNELFYVLKDNLKNNKNIHLWIKFMYDIIIRSNDNDNDKVDIVKSMNNKIKQEIYDTLQLQMNTGQLEDDSMPVTKTKTIGMDKSSKSKMKKIFRFGAIFGETKGKKNDETQLKGNQVNDERVSFRRMAYLLCDKLKNNLIKTEEPKEEKKEEEKIDVVENKKYSSYSSSKPRMTGMAALFGFNENDINEQYISCQKEIETLREKINDILSRSNTLELATYSSANNDKIASMNIDLFNPRLRKKYQGHFGKIYSLDWSRNSKYIVSASQDGKLQTWNAETANKTMAIPLRSAWVMTCAYSPSGEYIASGGLDNLISIFRVSDDMGWNVKETYRELQQHEGYVSDAKFYDNNQILSASGDASIILWDIEKQAPLTTFIGHNSDVEVIDIYPKQNIFVSGSIDATLKLWDIRVSTGKHIMNFKGHQTDINAVRFFPDGNAIISGSDDTTVKLWDIKACRQMNQYGDNDIYATVTDVDVSKSGKYIFAGYDEYPFLLVWSTLTANKISQLDHPSRVSCLGVRPDGYGIATGCWDKSLRLWA